MFQHRNPNGSQDFTEEARISDMLFNHFTRTWKDRQIYYMARERAKVQKDLLTIIIDSYDHAKMCLPKYPMGGRTPKRTIYENTRRHSLSLATCWLQNVTKSLKMFNNLLQHHQHPCYQSHWSCPPRNIFDLDLLHPARDWCDVLSGGRRFSPWCELDFGVCPFP